jgi:hypothetical protein
VGGHSGQRRGAAVMVLLPCILSDEVSRSGSDRGMHERAVGRGEHRQCWGSILTCAEASWCLMLVGQ